MNGQGCNCTAKSEADCACGVDWTTEEVYELRARCLGLGKDKELLKVEKCKLDVEIAKLKDYQTGKSLWKRRAEHAEVEAEELKKEVHKYKNSVVDTVMEDSEIIKELERERDHLFKATKLMMKKEHGLNRAMKLGVEALEELDDFEDDGIHPPKNICLIRTALSKMKESLGEGK